jgi:putative heme-binding domain-containing protein
VGRELQGTDPQVMREALSIIGMRRTDGFDDRIDAMAKQTRDDGLRFAAIVLLARHGRPLADPAFDELFGKLGGETSPVDQLAAAEGLGGAKLTEAQRNKLLGVLAGAGPLELPALVQAFDKCSDPAIGKQLIAALEKSSGTENLSPERLHSLFTAYPSEIRAAAEPLTMRLNVDLPKQRARIAELSPQLDGGRVQVGRNVFFGKKALCSACHRVRGEGSLIGPDLTKVGQIRSRADLIESVVYPSSSFARGYESFSIQTDSGLVYTGVIARETSDSVYLKTAQREEVRIPRSEIEQVVPSKVSIMPQGFDKLLTVEELRDVLAFLQTLK